jgi:hypothetical protein
MIKFEETTHEYFIGDKKLISVTQLMRKHGLAPNYDNVPSEVLNAKAERGTLIHREIEKYIKSNEMGFTTELYNFIDYIKENNITVLESEKIVYNDIVAGTADLFLLTEDVITIADIKTTASLHKEAVSWQLSIYAYLRGLSAGDYARRGEVYHFNSEGELTVKEIPLKPFVEVERLFECERNGEIYQQALEIPEAELAELFKIETIIKHIEEQKKIAEEQAAELRAALMEAMEQNGVTSFENENIKITYVAATTRASIDSTKLKKDLPEIAQQYTKTSNVKASLRITIKGAE